MASGDYSLGADLIGCALDGIDILASNVTLHVNGHSISGNGTTSCIDRNGIHVGTTLAALSISMVRVLGTGTITDFFNGLLADNSTGSFVKFVTVTAPNCTRTSNPRGLIISSSSSMWKLDSNTVNNVGVDGIELDGNDNTVVNNVATQIGAEGIFLSQSSNNAIVNNSSSNCNFGIALTSGSSNNDIDANTTEGNAVDGILLQSNATSNNINGNKSFNNGTFDMEDGNFGCDNNKWTGNHFDTANQPCIH
jgi:parallel beta-helix repeat protein